MDMRYHNLSLPPSVRPSLPQVKSPPLPPALHLPISHGLHGSFSILLTSLPPSLPPSLPLRRLAVDMPTFRLPTHPDDD